MAEAEPRPNNYTIKVHPKDEAELLTLLGGFAAEHYLEITPETIARPEMFSMLLLDDTEVPVVTEKHLRDFARDTVGVPNKGTRLANALIGSERHQDMGLIEYMVVDPESHKVIGFRADRASELLDQMKKINSQLDGIGDTSIKFFATFCEALGDVLADQPATV